MRIFVGVLASLVLAVGCSTTVEQPPTDSEGWNYGPAPSFLDPSTSDVVGHGCAYTLAEWVDGRAAELLDDQWSRVETLEVNGARVILPVTSC